MDHYYGYWPVLAIIKQYLSNVKKRLAQDLKAEQDDAGLPGSKSNESQNTTPKADEKVEGDTGGSSRIKNANNLKTAAPEKTKKRRPNGSGKGRKALGVEEELKDVESEDEESEDELSEFEVEERDEDEMKVDGGDETDLDSEDDKAEMEICDYYASGMGLDCNSKQDDDNERHKSNDGGTLAVEKSVEYRLFLIYLSLTWTWDAFYCK
jgi:hypothetical protein